MRLGKVVGTLVCSRKEQHLHGKTMLFVQPILPSKKPVGKPIVAIDTIGAGVGEIVFFVRGKESSFPMLPEVVPTDASITGIIDDLNYEEP